MQPLSNSKELFLGNSIGIAQWALAPLVLVQIPVPSHLFNATGYNGRLYPGLGNEFSVEIGLYPLQSTLFSKT